MNTTECIALETSQRELAAGVFKQVAQDLRRFHGATTAVERQLYFDAYSWAMSDDCSWPFSFLNVCQLLNLAPEDAREELIGDLSLSRLNQWARRCGRAARWLQICFGQLFVSERNLGRPKVSLSMMSGSVPVTYAEARNIVFHKRAHSSGSCSYDN